MTKYITTGVHVLITDNHNMSTHQSEINTFGKNWLGKNHDIYRSKSGNFFNTVSEAPPLPCFNCGKMHWRKDCPRGIYHGLPGPKRHAKFTILAVVYDDEE